MCSRLNANLRIAEWMSDAFRNISSGTISEYTNIAIELLIGFAALFLATKVLGKAHLSQLTPFDFISALLLGELLGNAIYDTEVSIAKILFAIALWGGLIYGSEALTQRFVGMRKLLEGEPTVIIHKGEIRFQAMKQNELDINQLNSMLRQKGYFSIREGEYAILETNGDLSVLPKKQFDTPTVEDLKLPAPAPLLPVALIIDGKIIHANFRETSVNEQWLLKELKRLDIRDPKEVLYAEWREGEPLYVKKYK